MFANKKNNNLKNVLRTSRKKGIMTGNLNVIVKRDVVDSTQKKTERKSRKNNVEENKLDNE